MQAEYQASFVIISIAIAIFSACISLAIMDGVNALPNRLKQLRIVSAGVAFATGVWTMHFVGMLAVQLPMPLAYSPALTLASYLFSIIGTIPAMALITVKEKQQSHQMSASILLATAICIMHYSGMASMRMSPPIAYDTVWVLISFIFAFVASYIGLYITGNWGENTRKKRWVFYSAGIILGVAVSAMHYSGMEAAHFSIQSISQATYDEGALEGAELVFAVVSASLLVMVLLLFTSLSEKNIILWKVLFVVGIAELTIMLVLPVVVPASFPRVLYAVLDVFILLILVFPIAWRIRVNGLELLDNQSTIKKTLEAQQATNKLLSLPLNEATMEVLLNKALRIIQGVSWLKTLPQGAIFLNDAKDQSLTMVAEYNLAPQISQQCARVKHGECLCGTVANTMQIQHHNHVNTAHTTHFSGMKDHGHYNMPLSLEGKLYGVLCLYLNPGQKICLNEASILQSFSVTITELIRHKQALDESQLAKTVFENNLASMVITDAEQKILNVNPGFTRVTGFLEEEVVGKTLAVLKSGKHDKAFYQAMWKSLGEYDRWEGEIWNKRKNGEIYPQWTSIATVRDNQAAVKNYIASFDDISDRKAAEKHINQLAYYDSLTDLPNRSLFYDRLEQAILQAGRDKTKVAVLFLDLDQFKEVNDTFGHEAGDALLKVVAKRISFCLRASDTLARLGGDEFVIILRELEGDESYIINSIQKIVTHILEQIREDYDYQGHILHSAASIGVVIFPDNALTSHQLIQQADTAMYEAKKAGRNTYRFFSQEMTERILKRNQLSRALRKAIAANELSIYYQPLVDAGTQKILGAEALLRWHSATLGLIPTVEFIALAEDIGLIEEIGEWVIERVCVQYKQWQKEKLSKLGYISVNVSIHQLISVDFADKALLICQQTGMATENIEFEITEGGLAKYPDTIMDVLHQLRSFGFKLAIDDFGTDYSSLARLKAFDVDLLKIDRSFVRNMTTDEDDAAIVRAIIDLGAALGLTTLAEGVETVEQFELLKSYDCDRCQGYYFGKPVCAEEFAGQWLV